MPAGKAHFSVDIAGDRELSRSLHGYLGRMQNLRPWLVKVHADWSATMLKKFASDGAAEGEAAWAPLSEQYAAWKARKYPGRGILVRTGALQQAAVMPDTELSDTQLRMTIDNDYAIFHQSSEPRESNLPRRPFASLTGKQKSRWMRLLRQHLMDEG